MIRNLKVLVLAGMAMAAFGAFAASGAQAAEFHCSVEPCRYTLQPDGTGKTAHQVFQAKNSAGEFIRVTCPQLAGEATTTGKAESELTVTRVGLGLPCSFLGSAIGYNVNGCNLVFGAAGTFAIKGCKGIVFPAPTGCSLELPEQEPVSGVAFHNVGEEAKGTTEITGEINALPIAGSLTGTTGQCGIDMTKTPITVEYLTGNFLITGETDPGGVMANAWWS